ncbi:MAG: hypothetical protein Q8R79_07740 [Legionellaceae bacterium]|nr:hypothetical protein [Legionellaceae bacterium]
MVKLWGYHPEDYAFMFDAPDFSGRTLEYACGPSTLSAENRSVINYLPEYTQSPEDLKHWIDQQFAIQCSELSEEVSVEIIQKRSEGILHFLQDYPQGKLDRRYISDLTDVPYCDLAISAFHFFQSTSISAISEEAQELLTLTTKAKEVRIYPVQSSQVPTILGPILLWLQDQNVGLEVRSLTQEKELRQVAMLRLWAQACSVE